MTLEKLVLWPSVFFKLIRPGNKLDGDNIAKFIVPRAFTRRDVANYLKSIYNVDVKKVNTAILPAKFKTDKRKHYGVKKVKGSQKVAYVHLYREFKFPELYAAKNLKNSYDQRIGQQMEMDGVEAPSHEEGVRHIDKIL